MQLVVKTYAKNFNCELTTVLKQLLLTYFYFSRTCYQCYNDERKIDEIIPKSSSLYHPYSLAVDSDHDHIYWSDSSHNAIIRSELNGSNIIYVLNRTVGIGHIVLDSTNRWILKLTN